MPVASYGVDNAGSIDHPDHVVKSVGNVDVSGRVNCQSSRMIQLGLVGLMAVSPCKQSSPQQAAPRLAFPLPPRSQQEHTH